MNSLPDWPIYVLMGLIGALAAVTIFGLAIPTAVREWRDLMREIREDRRP